MKIAFIVEPDFINRHVGVRNYALSIKKLLDRHAHCDFVSFFRSGSGDVHWFKITLCDPHFAINCGLKSDVTYTGTPEDVYDEWYENSVKNSAHHNLSMAYTQFGPNLQREGYDLCVISNPWLIQFDEAIPIDEQFGIAYDAIPNRYTLTTYMKPFEFAGQHARGYAYFRRYCRATFAISESTRTDLVALFGFDPAATIALPPLLPAAYIEPTTVEIPDVRRRASIVLASPLDVRKGLDVMPALINPVVRDGSLEKLWMYGKPRCSEKELTRFFTSLDPATELSWSPQATAGTVKKMLASSRLCLFPSTHEGLGLPILESQICGCRVLARDIDPLNRNLLSGAILMKNGVDEVHSQIRSAVRDDAFDHDALRAEALQRFNPDSVSRVLCDTLSNEELFTTDIYHQQRRAA